MICGMTYFQICLYFLVYSFGGWVVEVIFHAVALGKVIKQRIFEWTSVSGIWIWSALRVCTAQYDPKWWTSDE